MLILSSYILLILCEKRNHLNLDLWNEFRVLLFNCIFLNKAIKNNNLNKIKNYVCFNTLFHFCGINLYSVVTNLKK